MNFLSNENIELIWKVISQTIKISKEQLIKSMNEYYKNTNIQYVLNREQLININKGYISSLKNMNMYTISQNNNKPTEYTFEDIQNKKRELFNEELNKKQKEFSSFNQVIIPPPLKFNEDIDKPISEMEQLIAKTIAERTLDIETIQKKMELPIIPVKIKIDKTNLNLEEKHISWKDEVLFDLELKEKINQIDKKLKEIIDLLNSNKN
jgi:hypothetical protein